MFDTIFVDGVDLATRVSCIQSLDGIYSTPNVRGSNLIIPGVDGEIFLPKSFDANVIELAIMINGTSNSDFNQAYRSLRRLIPPGKLLTLGRRLTYGGVTEDHTAQGEYVSGLTPSVQLLRFGKATIGLKVLEGIWYSSSTFATGTGSVTINGDVRTHRMTITMSPGTLTNNTTGTTLTYAGTGSATIDVESMTAKEGTNDTSSKLVWNQTYPFELAPGLNSISGTASIVYRAAYL